MAFARALVLLFCGSLRVVTPIDEYDAFAAVQGVVKLHKEPKQAHPFRSDFAPLSIVSAAVAAAVKKEAAAMKNETVLGALKHAAAKQIEFTWVADKGVGEGTPGKLMWEGDSCAEDAVVGGYTCKESTKAHMALNLTQPLDESSRVKLSIDIHVWTMDQTIELDCRVCGEACDFSFMMYQNTLPAPQCPIPAGEWFIDLPVNRAINDIMDGVAFPGTVKIHTQYFRGDHSLLF
eukprot:CAMPEP_0171067174 /NCGR_PEP_ID=MMETSP0766_2-20121228/7848_1 /TAXON_ID=439317 /ORGANISM="Gambierdiscus australes, Strain CAWD 149" /LENGTH=233 /DNA_ID=CAMNT_0011523393 /DNA_START=31 /DNA_END=729 /DNA_ORIENTATION=-